MCPFIDLSAAQKEVTEMIYRDERLDLTETVPQRGDDEERETGPECACPEFCLLDHNN